MLHACNIVYLLMYSFIIHGGTRVREYMGKDLQDRNDVVRFIFNEGIFLVG
jgi:hypothetical protein